MQNQANETDENAASVEVEDLVRAPDAPEETGPTDHPRTPFKYQLVPQQEIFSTPRKGPTQGAGGGDGGGGGGGGGSSVKKNRNSGHKKTAKFNK